MPGRVRRDVPGGLRRLQLLPVPQPRLLEAALRRRARVAPVRLQGARGDHRRGLAAATPGTGPGPARPTRRSWTPACSSASSPAPLEPYQDRVATLIFEFGTIPKSVFATPADFAGRLDPFLGALPGGFRYAVEIRNPEYLGPGYFAMLARHNVAHVFNAWTRMPELADQARCPGPSRPISPSSGHCSARADLRAGRQPLRAVPGRPASPTRPRATALVRIADGRAHSGKPAYVFVNNRLEGHAPSTIEAVAEALEPSSMKPSGASTRAAVAQTPLPTDGVPIV